MKKEDFQSLVTIGDLENFKLEFQTVIQQFLTHGSNKAFYFPSGPENIMKNNKFKNKYYDYKTIRFYH